MSDWLRNTLAGGYYHTGLPSMARPFRERYSVTLSPGARLPTIRRRTGPTARVVYYHRVNDDNDPFFPATPTAVFEAQMRFLARHYRVVSLGQAVKHLDDGSPANVVAVTFDDGYRDNYEKAFPILQRYGIPATIFLTTDSIDSGEPLWFEQLSLSLKKTTRQRLDLPAGLPGPFPLRNEAERIECNGRIQDFLRRLPDSERRRWMVEILGCLAVVGDYERHHQMLTWEQVRYMNAHGIDFGGHTLSHPFLSRNTDEEAAREISGCKARIQAELQESIAHFAYPNGRDEDVSASARELVRAAGYRAAVTTNWGPNDGQTDRMQLRRGGPWETSTALFAYKFDWYQLTDQ
jgi:peptidoglycan/xylan/chitin deacetylase (PgdA/CDA1 family)